jgi:hypothetical protein
VRKVHSSRQATAANSIAVIRLKQVEHVRNERNVLAKVAGHPFITTMVASFQSLESLYMVVGSLVYHSSLWSLTFDSSTTALAVKYSATYEERDGSTSPHRSSTLPRLC